MNRLNSNCYCIRASISQLSYSLYRLFSVTSETNRCHSKILKHFKVNNQESILKQFPNELTDKISRKEPKSIYVANENTANSIAKTISKYHKENVPFFECNPGPGILTANLLQHLHPKRLRLIEKCIAFSSIQAV